MAEYSEYLRAAIEAMRKESIVRKPEYKNVEGEPDPPREDDEAVRRLYMEKGEQRLCRLIQRLTESGQQELLLMASQDPGLRERLYEKFGIE